LKDEIKKQLDDKLKNKLIKGKVEKPQGILV
jgi:hypothetical protein